MSFLLWIWNALRHPVFWGLVGTGLVIWAAIWSASLPACFEKLDGETVCGTKLFYLTHATPNEVGDTLAGFAGALAFIWIIVTVVMQSLELAAQREELALTRKEFEQISAAQREQVRFMEIQTELLQKENTNADAKASGSIASQRFDALCEIIRRNIAVRYHYNSKDKRETEDSLLNHCPEHLRRGSDVEFLEPSVLLRTATGAIASFYHDRDSDVIGDLPFVLAEIMDATVELGKLIEDADQVTKDRFKLMMIDDYASLFQSYMKPE